MRRKARPGSSTGGSARRRASGSRAIGRKRWNGFTASATRVLRSSTSTSIWLRITASAHGYTWLKLHLQWAGVVPKAPRKGAHRRKRERRPLPGMMLHQDGSRHEWLERQPQLDLIVTLDDATGAIHSAFLVDEEGTASTFWALKEVFSEHGLPMSLYTDRGSHYFLNHQGRRDRPRLTDPGRPGP